MDLLFTHGGFFALLQVVLIDIVLAGDNALVIGMAAARVPQVVRRKVIFWGLVAAVVARVVLAAVTVELLEIIGLMFAGGVLLLWVCWKLWRDIREAAEYHDPITHLRERLSVSDEEFESLDAEIHQVVDDAVEFAKNGTDPQPEDALKNIYA